jgi:hypothetical protein
MNSPVDGRVFLCNDVPPGSPYDFSFNVSSPPGASSPLRMAVRMVQDGVQWFGQPNAWTVRRL